MCWFFYAFERSTLTDKSKEDSLRRWTLKRFSVIFADKAWFVSCFRKCLCTIFLFCLKWFSAFMRFSFGYCLRLCLIFGFLNSLSWMFGYFASMLYIKKISETQFYKIKTWFIFTISIYKLKFNPTMNLVRKKFKYF